jgi:hypothetical protein
VAPAANALLKLNQQGPRASNPSQGPCACCLIKSALFTYIHTYIHACIHVVVTRLIVLTNDVGRTTRLGSFETMPIHLLLFYGALNSLPQITESRPSDQF